MQTTRRWVPTGFRARTAPGPPADAPPGSPVPVPRSLHSADTVRRDVSIQLALVLLGVVAFAIGILPLGDRYGAVSKLIGGSSSLGAVCYVAWCYRVRCWRRYPNQLLMWRALATGIASATIFATAALELSFPPRELPGRFCPSLAASANPLLVQFGFLAHEGWALVMALDVFLLMQDPFTDNANLQRIYHLLVWGGSALFTCWLAWGTRACAWGLAPTLRYGFAYLSDSEAPPPPMPPGFPPSALDSSLPLLRLEPSREELFRIEAQYCLHTWGGVPPPHDLRAADLLHTSCALNQSDTARFVCAALDAARAHANRTNAPWGDELQQGVCDVGALPPGESGGGGGSAAEGDPELPFGQRVCVGSATLFKPIHTLPVECWERTGIWSERVRRGEGDAAGGAGGGRAVDTGGGKRRGGGRWTLGDGAWALVAFAWAPLFGLVSLLLIVALGWTMNGASTRAMRAREAAISRNVDSVFHNQFLYWLPLYYIICQLGTLNVADCKWLVRSCRPLGTWRWYDDVHSTSEANWIGAMQVMISAQGLWTMMFFSSLHHSGLYSPSPLRALLGRAPAPSRSPPAARRGGWAAGPPTDTAGEYLPVGRSLFRISSGRSDMERERLDGDGGAVAAAQQWARAIDSGSPRRTAEVAERAEAAAEVEAAAAAAADFIDDNDPRGNMALRDEVLYCIRRGVSEACSVPYAELPIEGSDLHLELETAPMGGSQAHSLSLLSAQHGLAWWWRGDAPAERDGGARARAAESGKWAHAAGGPTGGLSSVRQDAIAQLSSSALSAASAAAPIPRGFRSQRFMLHSSLTTLQLLSLSWLLFARQVSGPAGAAAQWPPLPRALFSCSATQCVLEASRRDRAAAFAVADVGRRERDAAWPGFEHAGEVAAWLWDTARSERDAAAPRHGTGAPLEASPGTHTPTGLASGRSGAAGAVEQTAPDPPGAGGSGDAGRNAADASWPPMASVGSDGISESVNTNRVGHSDRERGGPSDGSSVERKDISELALPLQLRAPLSLFGRRRRLSLLSPRVNATETHGGRRRMGRASRISLDDEDSAAFGEWAYLTMTGAPSGDAAWGEWAEQGHIGEGLVDVGEGSAGGVGVDAATGILGASSPASAWGQHAWSRISEGGKALASATEAQVEAQVGAEPEVQRAQALWQVAMEVARIASGSQGEASEQQRQQDADELNAEWHDPCVWISAANPLLLLLSLGLTLTSSRASGAAVWEAFVVPHTCLGISCEAGALLAVAAYAVRVNLLVAPADGRAPRCALGGTEGLVLDLLLLCALVLLVLPPAVASVCGTGWVLPWSAAAGMRRAASALGRATEDESRFSSAGGSGVSAATSGRARLSPAAPIDFKKAKSTPSVSANLQKLRSVELLSSFSSVRTMVATRVLKPRAVDFDAIAPRVFARMRASAGAGTPAMLASIHTIDHAGGGLKGGASGAFLFPSRDGQLVVKTLNAEEAVALQRLAPAFAAHHARHPDSLINHFLGQFRMFLYGRTIHFVVLRSAFHAAPPHSTPTVKYDLKGSWVKRSAKTGESTLKDNDMRKDGFLSDGTGRSGWCEALPLALPPVQHAALLARLEADSAFLASLNVMDYSLLLCAFEVPSSWQPGSNHSHANGCIMHQQRPGLRSPAPPFDPIAGVWGAARGASRDYVIQRESGVLLVGVIDVLQAWTCHKIGERCLKTYVQRKDAHGVSAVPAAEYQARFMRFMREIFAPMDTAHVEEGHDDHGAPRGAASVSGRLLSWWDIGRKGGSSTSGAADFRVLFGSDKLLSVR